MPFILTIVNLIIILGKDVTQVIFADFERVINYLLWTQLQAPINFSTKVVFLFSNSVILRSIKLPIHLHSEC